MNIVPDAAPLQEATPPGFRWYGGEPQSWQDALRDLWQHRELLWLFALRDLQVRYRQAWAGVLWAVIQPAAGLAIFTVLFGLLGRVPTDGSAPYFLVVWCGLLPWQFFQSVVTASAQSLVNHRSLITKAKFPRQILPLSAMLTAGVDFAIAGGILLIALVATGRVSLELLTAPLFLLIVVVLTSACAMGLSALNALYRDAGHAVPLILQVLFFLTPVVYQGSALIPERFRAVWSLNPLVGAIEGLRWACLGTPCPSAWTLIAGGSLAAVCWWAAWRFFQRVEHIIVDTI